MKSHTKTINLEYQLQHGMKNLNYLLVHFSVSDIQDYFQYILKNHEERTIHPSIRVYVNKIENRITFKF